MTAREFLENWYGIELQNYHKGDADVDIASYLYDDISNGDIDELLTIMERYAQEYSNSTDRRMDE